MMWQCQRPSIRQIMKRNLHIIHQHKSKISSTYFTSRHSICLDPVTLPSLCAVLPNLTSYNYISQKRRYSSFNYNNASIPNATQTYAPSYAQYPLQLKLFQSQWFSSNHRSRGTRERVPRMSEMRSLEEALTATYDNLDRLSPRDVSAFWAVVPKFLGGRGPSRINHRQQQQHLQQMFHHFDLILTNSIKEIDQYSHRELATLAISFAKIIDKISKRKRHAKGSPHQILQDLIGENKQFIFREIASSSVPILHEFDARHLSNFIYAFGLAKEVILVEGGSTFFDMLAKQVTSFDNLDKFNGQGLSNIVWAYATAEESPHPLFKKVADHIVGLDNLNEFNSQNLKDVVWAYATAREQHPKLFKRLANHIVGLDSLHNFKPQHLSNIVWAFTTAEEPHPKLFEKVTNHIVQLDNLDNFKPQELKDVVWSYATAGEAHPKLFENVAEHIVELDSLKSFNGQDLSNTVWAFATSEESHPQLFKKVADHIVGLNNLNDFWPQALKDLVWAFATADESHPKLFKKVADHIVGLNNLDKFIPQHLSNTLWSFATSEVPHPQLYKKVADHTVQLPSLDEFKPQALKDILWALATAGESHPQLFNKLADEAIKRQHEIDEQGIANFLWACATNGQVDKHLFSSLVPSVKDNLDKYCAQGLANVAWAYSVANVDAPSVFNEEFTDACLRKENSFNVENLSQLHQWQLWHEELKSDVSLPQSLEKRCYDAFISRVPQPSRLQDDVVSILSSMGLQPQEEVLMKSGYRIDAVVEVDGKQIAVEVDGPSHFIGRRRELTGSTILKHRQVAALDEMSAVVSVPYWDWNKLKKDSKKKKQYLGALLGI